MEERAETEYHSKDFEWEHLRAEVEDDPSLSHHFQSHPSSSQTLTDSHAWNRFHARHSSGKFFKERRYLLKEFPELVDCKRNSKLLEVGCGSGSTALSILRGNESIVVYACDCSVEILHRAKEIMDASGIAASEKRFLPFFCDFSRTGFPSWLACDQCRDSDPRTRRTCFSDSGSSLTKESGVCIGGLDFVTLIFTLSAVPRKEMPVSIKECLSVLKPGGLLFFRDYGLYDMTMLRFESNQRTGFREYVRSDGTLSYFFCLDTTRALFLDAGFIELELEYCCVKSVNRRNGKSMRRVWVHGKFQKPA